MNSRACELVTLQPSSKQTAGGKHLKRDATDASLFEIEGHRIEGRSSEMNSRACELVSSSAADERDGDSVPCLAVAPLGEAQSRHGPPSRADVTDGIEPTPPKRKIDFSEFADACTDSKRSCTFSDAATNPPSSDSRCEGSEVETRQPVCMQQTSLTTNISFTEMVNLTVVTFRPSTAVWPGSKPPKPKVKQAPV